VLAGIVGYVAGNSGAVHTAETDTTTTTFTFTNTSYSQIISLLFASHIQKLEIRNTGEVVLDYEPNAVLVWEGNSQGLGGTYDGVANISLLYNSFLGESDNLSITNSTYSSTINSTGSNNVIVVVNSTLSFFGYNKFLGNMTAIASARIIYEKNGDDVKRLISNETWDFLQFYASAIHATA